ncbi:hypothetical protein VP01_504g7 [Puccinia sorghi]|uniref:Beta-fructofuranosidase n=1 Tax=Puccinia sorghi TaxID=27349 RepID=A0A0L6ULJ9_9BASI|nr:hypothetical protein VP01_504g7 [Puccinia sorghi]
MSNWKTRLVLRLSAAVLIPGLTLVTSHELERSARTVDSPGNANSTVSNSSVHEDPQFPINPAPPAACRIDRSRPPQLQELVGCKNASLFNTWRPKARVIGPRGWMNDPMAILQSGPPSAFTTDFVHFTDHSSWKDPRTMVPTQLYDIRGVFDGTVIKDGWNGNPSIIYTSVFTGPLGSRSDPPEVEGVETQSIAYTQDDGHTWTKLNFGSYGNPVIKTWPEQHLSGFRDPFVFKSAEFSNFYANQSMQLGDRNGKKPSGDLYLLLSGGIRKEADPINGGPRLFLYRQTERNDITGWTYLGPLVSSVAEYNQTSEWTGSMGINFECGAITKVHEYGLVNQQFTRYSNQLNVIVTGTEGGRSGPGYWPVWHAVSWDYNSPDGHIKSKIDFSGVVDWGKAYAFHLFESKNRQLLVGWTYDDDVENILTPQRGGQGAFTLFRELYVQVIRNLHPASLSAQENGPSWTTRVEADGSHTLMTVGQRILPEITEAFRKHSTVFQLPDRTMNPGYNNSQQEEHDHQLQALSTNLVPLAKQPKDRFYLLKASLQFFSAQKEVNGEGAARFEMSRGGFRILSSQHEWTDIYYDPSTEYLVVDRSHSSTIPSFGNSTERAKLRLWSTINPETRETEMERLDLTIVVDNSVVEVHANERAIITTRVYPWYISSIGIEYLVQGRPTIVEPLRPARHSALTSSPPDSTHPPHNLSSAFQPHAVGFSHVEIWDGLLNAWPKRPANTWLPGVYSNNITSTLYGLWPDL